MIASYSDFLSARCQLGDMHGFNPTWMPDFLFDFQANLVEWACRKGRAAIFADCGLGKTPMQLTWAENVARHTCKPVLIVTPLAVAYQTAREAEKFGIECRVSRDGKWSGSQVVVTNYERLHYFDRHAFGGVVCDESSAIKDFDSARCGAVNEFMREMEYRLLCTATAAPNDFHELGTSSGALGYLGYRDMLTKFFKEEIQDDYLGWGRTKYRFRGHAEKPFWRWVCSWARAVRKPSDLGFDDSRFVLPPLHEIETVLENSTPRAGWLFPTPAVGLREEREERRITLAERCERVADMVGKNKTAVVWCQLNPEGDLLEKLIPNSKQVCGSMGDDEKEEVLRQFGSGELPVLVTKPKIGCWGLNWQHCSNVYTFPSHSFEQYYQAIRRCYRFGQSNPVTVNIIATAGEAGVIKNLKRKAEQAEEMFRYLVACMNDEMALNHVESFTNKEEVPSWL
mgnify:CR=1 FL=1